MMNASFGIYLHIPFCRQACSYCDFYFVTREKYRQDFVRRLVAEIRSYDGSEWAARPVHTVYFGGGTPSRLPLGELQQITRALEQTFRLDRVTETTLEANPDDVDTAYLTGLKQMGINRISMGVQSFDEQLLRFMHRAHSSRQALECMEALHRAAFDTYSVDLIYANPGQSIQQLEADLATLAGHRPPHVSAYALNIEPRTRLGRQYELGRLQPLEEDQAARHVDTVEQHLEALGLQRYEVSNFALPGHRARHNAAYWLHRDYIGLGPAAHSFQLLPGHTRGLRWRNLPDLQRYLAGESPLDPESVETLTPQQLAEERIMLGLRTCGGVDPEKLEADYAYRFNEHQLALLDRLEHDGLLQHDGTITLTRAGWKIADQVTLQLLSTSET